MKRLLFSTALISVSWVSAAAADPISAAIAAVTSAFTATFGAVIGPLLLRVVSSFALSTLGQLMRGKRSQPAPPGRRSEFATSGEYVPATIPVGRCSVKGHLGEVYTHTKRHGMPNRYMSFVFELADLPGIDLLRVAVGDAWSEIGTTNLDDFNDQFGSPLLGQRINDKDHAWIKFYDGTQTAADSMLVDVAGSDPDRPWTVNHIGTGIPYAIITLYRDDKVFSGTPQFLFEIDGIPLYDPRKDTTVGGSGSQRWSNPSTWTRTRNPKVIHYNLLRGIQTPLGVYGAGAAENKLPLDYWVAAMNVCDVDIVSASRTRKQYEAGIEIDVTEEPFVYARMLDDACGGQTAEMGGSWITECGPPAPAVLHITDDDISISDTRIFDPHPGLKDTYNGVSVAYIEPSALWRAAEVAPRYNPTWENEDGGRRLMAEIQLNAVYDYSQANQLGKGYIYDSRKFRTCQFVLPPEYDRLRLFDTISWTSARHGFINKLFQIKAITTRSSDMMVLVNVRERDPNDYDWTGNDDVPAPAYPQGAIPPDAQFMEGFTVAPYARLDAASNSWWPGIIIRWTPPEDSDIGGAKFRFRIKGKTAYEPRTTQDLEAGFYIIDPLVRDTIYQVQARWLGNRLMQWSNWTDVTTPDVGIPELALSDVVQTKLNAAADVTNDLYDLNQEYSALVDGFSGTLVDMQNSFGKEMLATGETVFAPFDGVAPTLSRAYLGLVGQPITDGIVLVNTVGWCIDSEGYTAVRTLKALEALPGRTYEITVRARVNVDDSNPSGNRQRGVISAFGLDHEGNYVSGASEYVTPPEGGSHIVNPFTVASGWQTFKTRITIQNDWRYWKCGFTYGASGTDARWRFSWMKIEDVTEGSAIRGLVTTLEGRTDDVEGKYENIVGLNLSGSTALGTLKTSLQVNASGVPTRIDGIDNAISGLGSSLGSLSTTVTANYNNLVALNVAGGSALGTLKNQLQVNAGGTSALINAYGTAIANLQNSASALYGIRVTTSGGTASGEFVSWDSPSGSGTQITFTAGNILFNGNVIVNGTITGNKIVDLGIYREKLDDEAANEQPQLALGPADLYQNNTTVFTFGLGRHYYNNIWTHVLSLEWRSPQDDFSGTPGGLRLERRVIPSGHSGAWTPWEEIARTPADTLEWQHWFFADEYIRDCEDVQLRLRVIQTQTVTRNNIRRLVVLGVAPIK